MPFKPPFTQKFSPNDLIYGLQLQRTIYARLLRIEIRLEQYNVRASIIDQYVVPREVDIIKTGQRQFYNMTLPQNLPYFQNFLSHLSEHPKYRTALTYPNEHPSRISGRKCKGSLSWITIGNNNLTEDMHIHFILDDIDMEYVVKKKEYPGAESNVTASELRWIFRNKEHPQVKRKIQFWKNLEPTIPPWEESGAVLWREYIPRNLPVGFVGLP
ncbi:hypothetical protein KKI93_18690 [Xenorhabdus bovienii]|uniref:hypothetical protein n=1 Tax=Xenorhabdus bovienii TaxID=40576 RepID=UPI0023B34CE0|nr:hypothetical protein [Xenorhabdus bovienii]MDE9544465.1 hypothetical protein [Xenorhabdus bovienii]MDE9566029.1 hypothetical protein [Xenorhabdus bovienii]